MDASEPLFAPGARVEVSDATGAWHGFSAEARVAGSGRKLVQSGRINDLKFGKFWQNGAVRFIRITNPDGSSGTVRLVRRGERFEAA
jgi:hypothetical protein